MLKKEFNDMLDNMSYEQQKSVLKQLDEIKQDDTQQFDDNWNAIEILVLSIVNCIKVIAKKLK